MQMFYPINKDGECEKISSIENFVEFYSEAYFIDNERSKTLKKKYEPYFSNLKKYSYKTTNRRYVEGIFDSYLEKSSSDSLSTEEIRNILAWKVGAINQKNSAKDKRLVFSGVYESWGNALNSRGLIRTRYSEIELSKLLESNLKSEALDQPENTDQVQRFLNHLKGLKIKGLGTVYMITLLYFTSKGNWPIYDKYSAIALEAISNDLHPDNLKDDVPAGTDGHITYLPLPDKNDKRFDVIAKKLLLPFRDKINDWLKPIGGYKRYQERRDYDRALWVYGHLFKEKRWMFTSENK